METPASDCPKCRAEVFRGASFCIRCGASLEARAPLPSSTRLKAQPPGAPRDRIPSETGYSLTPDRADATRQRVTRNR